MDSQKKLTRKIVAKKRDMYPAKGTVLFSFLFFNKACSSSEKNKEKIKRTIKEIVENENEIKIKNNISPSPNTLFNFNSNLYFEYKEQAPISKPTKIRLIKIERAITCNSITSEQKREKAKIPIRGYKKK